MTNTADIIAHIKSDLVLSNTEEYDSQLLSAVHSALRRQRGARYWFLFGFTSLNTTASSESIDIRAQVPDFGAISKAEAIYNGQRYTDKMGFAKMDFAQLRAKYWQQSPIPEGQPYAYAERNGTLYLSHKAPSVYTLQMEYYKQDASLPALSGTSIWYDEGYDLIKSLAQYIFKRDAQGMLPQEADADMVDVAKAALDKQHRSQATLERG
jgi:hypothetical protein